MKEAISALFFDWEFKTILATVISFFTVDMGIEPHILTVWLVVCTVDIIFTFIINLRETFKVFIKEMYSVFTKITIQFLTVIVVGYIFKSFVLLIGIEDIGGLFIDWVIFIMLITELLVVLNKAIKLGVPIPTVIINILGNLQTFSNNLLESKLPKNNNGKGL